MATKNTKLSWVTFRLPSETYRKLQDQAKKEDRTVSSLMRRIVLSNLESAPAQKES